MFVTLSRRSTSLVNQQLAQIERLEHDEEDPKRLESLFRLDHLASRMRRTADSLLILADAPNRAAGQFSLTVGEALQAATSGVQDYQRVQILSNLNTRVGDEAAADVVHLLTELVDNALTYSPPAEPVRLAAKQGPDGVTITITDSGLGVPAGRARAAQQRPRSTVPRPRPTPPAAWACSWSSRLAERHDITAHLARNPGGGMTATVLLPPSVLPDVPQTGAPAAPAATSAAAPATPSAAPTASTDSAELVGAPAAGPVVSKREARNRARAEKAEAKAAERAAAAEAKAEAKAAKAEADLEPLPAATRTTGTTTTAGDASSEPAAPAARPHPPPPRRSRRRTVRRSSSLLPRREPGANMPRTGADAFLPPETSGATGPLFGKRADAAEPAAKAETTGAEGAATERAEKVARVVPITALASRQRAQAEQEARSAEVPAEEPAEEPTEVAVAEEPAEQPVEQPARAHDPLSDPLSDPLPADAFDEPAAGRAAEPAEEVGARARRGGRARARRPGRACARCRARRGRRRGRRRRPAGPRSPGPSGRAGQPVVRASRSASPSRSPSSEVAAEPEPRARGAVPRARARAGAVVTTPPRCSPTGPASTGTAPTARTPSRLNGHGSNGLPHGAEPARAGGDSPIFKSMRSGWLAGEGEGEWHETEVDRGWEIAEHVVGGGPGRRVHAASDFRDAPPASASFPVA